MGDDAIANRQHHQELPLGGGGGEDGSPDLISRLPDEVLGDIISLLSIRDGARTQAISRRWRPLWRAAPLNLKVYGVLSSESKGVVTKILSEHTGPVRCFHLHDFELHGCYDYAMLDGWLRSRALTGLREQGCRQARLRAPAGHPRRPHATIAFTAGTCETCMHGGRLQEPALSTARRLCSS
nr:unnamed protein product [Digitaria exilis]